MIKFEVVNADGNILFSTKYKECIPSKSEIDTLIKAGYKIKINGKAVTKKKMIELLGEE